MVVLFIVGSFFGGALVGAVIAAAKLRRRRRGRAWVLNDTLLPSPGSAWKEAHFQVGCRSQLPFWSAFAPPCESIWFWRLERLWVCRRCFQVSVGSRERSTGSVIGHWKTFARQIEREHIQVAVIEAIEKSE